MNSLILRSNTTEPNVIYETRIRRGFLHSSLLLCLEYVLVYALLSNRSTYMVEVKKSLKLLVTVCSKIKNSFFWERKMASKSEGEGSQAM